MTTRPTSTSHPSQLRLLRLLNAGSLFLAPAHGLACYTSATTFNVLLQVSLLNPALKFRTSRRVTRNGAQALLDPKLTSNFSQHHFPVPKVAPQKPHLHLFSTAMESTYGRTRSGKEYSPWQVVKAPEDFDYGALLRRSTRDAEVLEMLDDIDVTPSEATDQTLSSTAIPTPFYSSAGSVGPSPCGFQSKLSAAPHKKTGDAEPKSMSKANKCRKNRCIIQKTEQGHRPSAAAYEKYVKGAATVSVNLDSINLPATSGGYRAKNAPKRSDAQSAMSKDELVEKHGFTPLSWNGIDPILVVDARNRVCVALAGRPNQEAYRAAAQSVHETLLAEGAAAGLPARTDPHLRGHFPAINCGAMHAKGTTNPINLSASGNKPMIARLLKNPHVRQLAAFASYSLSSFAPKLYHYTRRKLNTLYDKTPGLECLFPAHVSVFPTAAFNIGPNVWTYQHRDILNLAYGWCAIQALGNFDPTKGGHLVLWELRLVIEFPPGALVLIPSATITHSNIPVAEGDSRSSFTQYMPGGLFCWVDYGCSLIADCKKRDPELYREQLDARPLKWKKGLDLLTTVEELRASRLV